MSDHPDSADHRRSERHVDPADVERLKAEVTDLRLQLEEEVRTRRVTVIDDIGIARIRLATTPEGHCEIVLLTVDGFERIVLSARPGLGFLTVVSRSSSESPSRVDMFALDSDDGDADGAYVGVELVDRGNSVTGYSLYEGRHPRTWTDTP